jgi:hypothetical protein
MLGLFGFDLYISLSKQSEFHLSVLYKFGSAWRFLMFVTEIAKETVEYFCDI